PSRRGSTGCSSGCRWSAPPSSTSAAASCSSFPSASPPSPPARSTAGRGERAPAGPSWRWRRGSRPSSSGPPRRTPIPRAVTAWPGLRNHLVAAPLAALALPAARLLVPPKGRWGLAVPWLFCGLVAGELLVVHLPFVPPAPRRLAYPVMPPVRFLQEHLGD